VPAHWPAGSQQGQRVLILGLGLSGLAMARWCVRCGAAQVTVLDSRAAPPQLAALCEELPSARFICGGFMADAASGHDLICRSPGLPPAQLAPLLAAAHAHGTPVTGELGLFAAALAALGREYAYHPHVLAITGTNGKTTTASLSAHLLTHAGWDVALAGNIGPTLLDTLAQRLGACALPRAWVLELSSFQLDGAHAFAPTAATVLNISQDHLDWHSSTSAYVAAKARIFGTDTTMVLNREDAQVMRLLPPAAAPAPSAPPRRSKKNSKAAPTASRAAVLFGSDCPKRAGDWGLETVNGITWLVRAQANDAAGDDPSGGAPQICPQICLQRLMPLDALPIRGRHNALNALAALALAHTGGCPLAPLLHGLRQYRGEPHRVERIAQTGGIAYFDDSKGTNVAATVAALAAVGADHQRLAVILGGDGKGQDFAPLREAVARHAQTAVLLGRAAPQLRAALHGCGAHLVDARDMVDAVAQALLSPACASFDMFRDYQERAQHFAAAVQALTEDGRHTEIVNRF